MDFKEAYKAPFELSSGMVFDSNNAFCANILTDAVNIGDIIDKLNGDVDWTPKHGRFMVDENDPIKIVFKVDEGMTIKILWVRGWGRLTGVGGYNLDTETAIKVQDDFVKWIIKTLNK